MSQKKILSIFNRSVSRYTLGLGVAVFLAGTQCVAMKLKAHLPIGSADIVVDQIQYISLRMGKILVGPEVLEARSTGDPIKRTAYFSLTIAENYLLSRITGGVDVEDEDIQRITGGVEVEDEDIQKGDRFKVRVTPESWSTEPTPKGGTKLILKTVWGTKPLELRGLVEIDRSIGKMYSYEPRCAFITKRGSTVELEGEL